MTLCVSQASIKPHSEDQTVNLMILKVLRYIFLFVLLTASGPTQAASYETCNDWLTRNEDAAPFELGDENLLKPEEIRFLDKIFNRFGQDVPNRTTPKTTNPFKVTAAVRITDGRYHLLWERGDSKIGHHILPKYRGALRKLLRKFVMAIVTASKDNPTLRVPENVWLKAQFVGLRYFLNEGEVTPYLPPHRDRDSMVQSLLIFRRATDLKGAQTIIGWPDHIELSGKNGYMSPKEEGALTRVWQPNAKTNQLLVFNGNMAVHGTTEFDFTDAKLNRQNVHARDGVILTLTPFQ